MNLRFIFLVVLEDLDELLPTEAEFQRSHDITEVLEVDTGVTRDLSER